MKVGLFINTQFPEGVNLAERASPLANDAETKKPRWGDRGFRSHGRSGSGKSVGRNDRPSQQTPRVWL